SGLGGAPGARPLGALCAAVLVGLFGARAGDALRDLNDGASPGVRASTRMLAVSVSVSTGISGDAVAGGSAAVGAVLAVSAAVSAGPSQVNSSRHSSSVSALSRADDASARVASSGSQVTSMTSAGPAGG